MATVDIRAWTSADVDDIAALHARSWQATYRGIFTDEFLDGPVIDDRRRVWSERAAQPDPDRATFVALVDASLAGFTHVVSHHEDGPGALLDNLHVDAAARGVGLSSRLLARAASWAHDVHGVDAMHLWVAASNAHAIDVYGHLGAEVDRTDVHDDGGGPFEVLCMTWRGTAWGTLLERDRGAGS